MTEAEELIAALREAAGESSVAMTILKAHVIGELLGVVDRWPTRRPRLQGRFWDADNATILAGLRFIVSDGCLVIRRDTETFWCDERKRWTATMPKPMKRPRAMILGRRLSKKLGSGVTVSLFDGRRLAEEWIPDWIDSHPDPNGILAQRNMCSELERSLAAKESEWQRQTSRLKSLREKYLTKSPAIKARAIQRHIGAIQKLLEAKT